VSALDLAIEKLGAVKLPDGDYAYFDDGMRRWYVVDEDDLLSYVSGYLESTDEDVRNDAYSHWCASTMADEMAEGWEPSEVQS
jgi:hypothetical protein